MKATVKGNDSLKQQNKAVITSYRRGRHVQKTNQFLLEVEGCDSKAKAAKYIGKQVVWTSSGKQKKRIFGKVMAPHGNSGVLRARFTKGLPGTAIGSEIEMAE